MAMPVARQSRPARLSPARPDRPRRGRRALAALPIALPVLIKASGMPNGGAPVFTLERQRAFWAA
jgi:hypothetical protein